MTSREHARAVWVNLAELFGRDGSAAEGIDLDQRAPGGLTKWIRTSGGTWVGVVNVVVPMTDGSTVKFENQLVPARVLRPR